MADNADVVSVTNNLDGTRSKNYSYDAYNRISEYKTPTSNLSDMQYVIDAWSNLTNKHIQPSYGGENLQKADELGKVPSVPEFPMIITR